VVTDGRCSLTRGGCIGRFDCIYKTSQWIVFFTHSDWVLKLVIVFAIHFPALFVFCSEVFPDLLEKKKPVDAGYPLIWFIYIYMEGVLQLIINITSVSVKSGRSLPRCFAAWQIIYLHYSHPLW